MREQVKLLYELQETDSAIARTKKAIQALDGGAALAANLARLNQLVEEQEAAVRKTRTELRDTEMALKTAEDKRNNYRRRLTGQVTSGREIESIQKELDVLARRIGELEEKALELMDAVEPLEQELQKRRAAAAEVEKRLAEERASQDNQRQRLQAALASLEAQRQARAAAVMPDLLKRYEAIQKRLGVVAVALVEEGVCSACRMSIPAFQLRQLREEDSILTCSCQRILYLPERKSA
jgi:predicted  nucleic acid-binding Zn-ribbon protein